MLKGQAKTDYQRRYMRDYQRTKRALFRPKDARCLDPVQPKQRDSVIPNEMIDTIDERATPPDIAYIDADGYPVYGEG